MTITGHRRPTLLTTRGDAADVTALLPTRADVLERLAEVIPTTEVRPVALLVLGLVRRDDAAAVDPATLDRITTLLARQVRGDDWLARFGPAEYVILFNGTAAGAEMAVNRLLGSIKAEALPGLSASAGIAAICPGLTPGEILRRATLCLTTARTMGPNRIVNYRGAR